MKKNGSWESKLDPFGDFTIILEAANNNIKILNTSDLKPFEKENIFQITFIDLNGEKEKLVFDQD